MSGLRSLYGDIKRIIVSESNNAMRTAGATAAKNGGWDEGQWTLSDAHDKPDECDDLASANGGWYRLDDYPDGPHPFCACFCGAVRKAG
jgi:hypothetical protein